MALEERKFMAERHRRVPYTVGLTEALEADLISPDEYVRMRANLVGQGDILQTLIIPLFRQIIMKLRDFLEKY